jgi:hypothetical protein
LKSEQQSPRSRQPRSQKQELELTGGTVGKNSAKRISDKLNFTEDFYDSRRQPLTTTEAATPLLLLMLQMWYLQQI